MPSPFPGMDPYLEHPALWPDVHHRLITAIADALAPRLRPKYRVAIDKVEPEGEVKRRRILTSLTHTTRQRAAVTQAGGPGSGARRSWR